MPQPKQSPLVNMDSVKDIFGQPKGWMLYWGNLTILLLFVLLIGLANWIRYPDKVELEVQISTHTPPSPLVAYNSGAIQTVYVKEGAIINAGQAILLFDNPANPQDIKQLDLYLNDIRSLQQATDVLTIDLSENLSLGELGAPYVELINYVSTLKYWLKRSYQGQRAERLNSQLRQRKEQDVHLAEQFDHLKKDERIAQNNAQQYKELFEKGAASQLEVDNAASRLLQVQRQVEGQENLIIQNKIHTENLALEKIKLSEQLSDQITEQWLALKHQQRSLRQQLNSWSDQYLIKAKAAGIVTYFQPLTDGQYLEKGQQIGSTVPPDIDSLSFIAEGYLSDQAIGRIQTGQTVFIELNAYPYREFGQIKGQLDQLALAPITTENKGYRVRINLPQKLVSTYGRELQFRQQLKGKANIITEDRSLLDRILDRFKDLKNN